MGTLSKKITIQVIFNVSTLTDTLQNIQVLVCKSVPKGLMFLTISQSQCSYYTKNKGSCNACSKTSYLNFVPCSTKYKLSHTVMYPDICGICSHDVLSACLLPYIEKYHISQFSCFFKLLCSVGTYIVCATLLTWTIKT